VRMLLRHREFMYMSTQAPIATLAGQPISDIKCIRCGLFGEAHGGKGVSALGSFGAGVHLAGRPTHFAPRRHGWRAKVNASALPLNHFVASRAGRSVFW
jgi:hypothetical protein